MQQNIISLANYYINNIIYYVNIRQEFIDNMRQDIDYFIPGF